MPPSNVLEGAAPVSLAVPVVAAAPVLSAKSPAVTVTGKKVMSLADRVVVVVPGALAADPPYDSTHIPAVFPVKVQSTETVKSCTTWMKRSVDGERRRKEAKRMIHKPDSAASYSRLQLR